MLPEVILEGVRISDMSVQRGNNLNLLLDLSFWHNLVEDGVNSVWGSITLLEVDGAINA